MRILVFGQSGQVATELQRQADVIALSREDADLTDPGACGQVITMLKPEAVINAAAYTDVDKAEEDEEVARIVNSDAPAAMASAAANLGIPFLHLSTDYVFDGTGIKPWTPDRKTAPLGAYGRTKRQGEIGVLSAKGNSAILRTSWVFSAHGNNFVKTMVRLSQERDTLNIVADQIGGPTPASSIAAALLKMARMMESNSSLGGIYHFSGRPDVNWADFAREIFTQTRKVVNVKDIPTTEFPTPAKRPANSRLDCTSLMESFGIERPDWRLMLSDVLAELA